MDGLRNQPVNVPVLNDLYRIRHGRLKRRNMRYEIVAMEVEPFPQIIAVYVPTALDQSLGFGPVRELPRVIQLFYRMLKIWV